jgi:hypothetical protein
MQLQVLALFPGVPDETGILDMPGLIEDVQLAEQVFLFFKA